MRIVRSEFSLPEGEGRTFADAPESTERLTNMSAKSKQVFSAPFSCSQLDVCRGGRTRKPFRGLAASRTSQQVTCATEMEETQEFDVTSER